MKAFMRKASAVTTTKRALGGYLIMRREMLAITAALLAGLVLAVPVSATPNNQALDWGIKDADKITYSMTLVSEDSNLTEGFYVLVGGTPTAVPDNVVAWVQIPYPDITICWTNGTEIGLWAFYLLPAGNIFVPIANWSLLTSLVDTRPVITDIVPKDTANYWGYSFHTPGIGPNEEARVALDFYKADGSLAHYDLEIWDTVSDVKVLDWVTVRSGLPLLDLPLPPIILNNLVPIGIGIVVLVVIIVLVKKH